MPSVEFTSNSLYMAVPVHLQGNVGIGTNTPACSLDIVAPSSFGISETPVSIVSTGTADARSVSVSSDGNVVVVGKAIDSSDGIIYVHEYNGTSWNTSNLTIQPIPVGVYSGSQDGWRAGARGSISSDGTRVVAVRGFGNPTVAGYGNSAEIYHKVNGSWVSKAFIHHAEVFGWGWAISGDGNTVAFTAPDFTNFSNFPGYVYAYKYNAGTDEWEQTLARSYNYGPEAITLNEDGSVLAFSLTNIPSRQNYTETLGNNAVAYVHVLKYINGAWNNVNDDIVINVPNGYLYWHYYGKIIKMSSDGKTLVVGAPSFGGGWGSPVLNAVHVYNTIDGSWTNISSFTLQPASYSAPTPNDYDNHFGNAITVNHNGSAIVVGAHAADVGTMTRAGRVWVFQKVNNVWGIAGILNGTTANMSFGSAVDVTGDGYYAYIAARYYQYTGGQTMRGITKYRFMSLGTAISAYGNTHFLGNKTIDGAVDIIGDMSLNGDMSLDGNMSLNGNILMNGRVSLSNLSGTIPQISVLSPYSYTKFSYQSRQYEDYTTWAEYINRIPISDNMSIYNIPDLGFDFFVSPNQNSRSSISIDFVGNLTLGTFGDQQTYMKLFGSGDIVNGDNVSYYSGMYNGSPAMYVFYKSANTRRLLAEWCVVLSNNKITVFLKEAVVIESLVAKEHYIYGGGETLALPFHNIGNISEISYTININFLRGNAVKFDGYTLTNSIGIGTASPKSPLHIVAGENNNGIRFDEVYANRKIIMYSPYDNVMVTSILNSSDHTFYGFGVNPNQLRYQVSDQNASHVFFAGVDDVTSTELMRITGTGNVGIGTTTPATALVVNGTIRNINGPAPTSGTSLVITGSGDIAPQSSDARYKTEVEDLPPMLDALMNVRPVSYKWKEDPQKWYGLLAQQVSEVFPDAAWHNAENDTYGVHYTPTVVTMLLKAVQELKEIVVSQNERIQQLEAKVN